MNMASKKRKTPKQTAPPKMKEKTQNSGVHGTPDDDQYFSRGVAKAFQILNFMHLRDKPITLNDMSAQVELTKSSCYRLLHTLQTLNLVTQRPDGHYVLERRSWGNSSTQVAEALLRESQSAARGLNEEFRETVSIAVLFTNHIEVIQTFESSKILRMANTVGRILPPHASSLGKAITAFQAEVTSRQLLVSYGLQPITCYSITDEVLLRQELDRVRAQGYAYEGEESTPDGCCFGAPIMLGAGADRYAAAAISISMPKSRVPEGSDREHMVQRLLEAAAVIGKDLTAAVHQRKKETI
jgi:DNA-binding IclR family transcriptional regulator